MGDKSKIEWTDATWNPVSGCTKVSQGCKNCYAERLFPRAYAKKATGNGQQATVGAKNISPVRKFTDVQCHPERLDYPLHWKKPRKIFVNSMSDLFHEDVPVEFIDRVFAVMAQSPQHTYQILTKRPERMRDYSAAIKLVCPKRRSLRMRDAMYADHPARGLVLSTQPAYVGKLLWPLPNVHLGVSIEDQPTADERIPLLLQTPAAVRFISYEPALGPVDLRTYLDGGDSECSPKWCNHPFLLWVICGGESGPNARPMHPDWARSLRDQCVAAGVPFFFKQWGEWAPGRSRPSGTPGHYALCPREYEGPIYEVNCYPREFTKFGSLVFERVGKKAAGAMLDGQEWREFPK